LKLEKERESQVAAEGLKPGVYTWGSGLFGQLGQGSEKQVVTSP